MRVTSRTRPSSRRPILWRIFICAATIFAAVALAWISFVAGERARTVARSQGAETSTASRIAEIEADLEQSRQQLANVQAALEIGREASARVREDLAKSQARIGQLEQEVQLYQGLLDNSVRRNGVSLHTLAISAGDCEGCYKLRVILVQKARKYADVAGNMRISVKGTENTQSRVLAYPDVGVPRGITSLPIRLRYFQVFEGLVELPRGFVPESMTLDVEITHGGRQRLTEQHEWVKQEDG